MDLIYLSILLNWTLLSIFQSEISESQDSNPGVLGVRSTDTTSVPCKLPFLPRIIRQAEIFDEACRAEFIHFRIRAVIFPRSSFSFEGRPPILEPFSQNVWQTVCWFSHLQGKWDPDIFYQLQLALRLPMKCKSYNVKKLKLAVVAQR